MADCMVFWGSHGCDKPKGHEEEGDLIHQCGTETEDPDDPDYNGGPCTQMIKLGPETKEWSNNAAVRYSVGSEDAHEEWGSWAPFHWFT